MDNYYQECPPMMNDARIHTDYKTATRRNEYIKYVNGIYRNDHYRLFLQNNAAQIMDNEWTHVKENNKCWIKECVHSYPLRSLPSHLSEEMRLYNCTYGPDKEGCGGAVPKKCGGGTDFRLTYNGEY